MQERAVVHQVGRVRAAWHVTVDSGVAAADDLDGRAADPEPVAGPHDRVVRQAGHGGDRIPVDPQPRAGIGREQRREPGGVDVVGVLVRDQHRIEVTDLVEPGQHARVEQQARPAGLGEQAGMAQVRQPHRRAPPDVLLNILSL